MDLSFLIWKMGPAQSVCQPSRPREGTQDILLEEGLGEDLGLSLGVAGADPDLGLDTVDLGWGIEVGYSTSS